MVHPFAATGGARLHTHWPCAACLLPCSPVRRTVLQPAGHMQCRRRLAVQDRNLRPGVFLWQVQRLHVRKWRPRQPSVQGQATQRLPSSNRPGLLRGEQGLCAWGWCTCKLVSYVVCCVDNDPTTALRQSSVSPCVCSARPSLLLCRAAPVKAPLAAPSATTAPAPRACSTWCAATAATSPPPAAHAAPTSSYAPGSRLLSALRGSRAW